MSDPAVDTYLAAQPEANRVLLERVRATVADACPDAVEVISYGMPGFRVGGKLLISFAGYRRHCSLYPATAEMQAALGDELTPFLAEKATIRFSPRHPLPEPLLRRIVEILAAERGS
jgi:uncharacterized protein YdhG (YjbR/CyaY superfamily)